MMTRDRINSMDYAAPVLIEGQHLRFLQNVMDRLYAERTLNGEQMRDMAQLIQVVLDSAQEAECA